VHHHVGVIVGRRNDRQMGAGTYPAIQAGSGFATAGDGAYAYFDRQGTWG
jgi:hypothetical protein